MREQITLLIVEDHEISRIGLRIVLEQVPHFKVLDEALDGAAAIEKSLALNPKLVLMDIGLPVVDGVDAMRQIKTKVPGVRVLVLTSMTNDDSVFACLSAGADGYALKDAPTEQLIMAIEVVARGDAWIDPAIARRIMAGTVNKESIPTRPTDTAVFGLSRREMEVLELLVEGLTNQEIALRLSLSAETIKSHVARVMHKLSVSDRTQAAVKALKQGIVAT